MNHWAFVIAAYGITFAGTVATSLWAWRTARSAERRATQLLERE